MRYFNLGSECKVTVSPNEIWRFGAKFPCSGMIDFPSKCITFIFQVSNFDLVEVHGIEDKYDHNAVTALMNDARNYARSKLTKR